MFAGVVLCGGKSRRLGRDKALLEIGGRPLHSHVSERLAQAADPVFVAPGVPGRLGPTEYREVADEVDGSGPLGGIVAALRASPHGLLAVVAVDMPFVHPTLLRLLEDCHSNQQAVVPVTEEGAQPLHALYSKDALQSMELALAEGRLSLRALLSDLDVREVNESEWRAADPSGRFAVNINRDKDLARFGLD